MVITNKGFGELRADMYERAIIKYPKAREEDIFAMHKHLSPKYAENILGIGEGNGYFCNSIIDAIGKKGKYIVTDPSRYQLENLSRKVKSNNLEIQVAGAEDIEMPLESIDKVWSFGAFHHCPDQTQAMKRIYSALKPEGKAVICDVFQGGSLAKHFDEVIARYCNEGHEVKFLSEEFARSITYLAGFKDSKISILDLFLNL